MIDIHHHFCAPEYARAIEARTFLPAIVRDWTPERSIADMDAGGIARSILSVTTPGLWFGSVPETCRLARISNDHAVAVARQFPGRFGLFAALPMPDVDGTLSEIVYALDVLRCEGVGVFTSYDDAWLGDPRFAPVFAELNRRKTVVFVHPTINECCREIIPVVAESIVEYGTDTSRTIASLLFTGAAARYPDVQFVFSHGGGTVPFLIERFVNYAKKPEFATALPHGVMHELQRFYYDTAQACNRSAMTCLNEMVPASQILFGTDFPYRNAAEYVGRLPTCGFGPADIAAIERGNAVGLLAR
jgi:predicted TIM-barrel fold metal-dependent hydrolase